MCTLACASANSDWNNLSPLTRNSTFPSPLGNLHQSKGNAASSPAIVANAWNRMNESQKPNALWWGHPKTSWASGFSYDWNMILSLRHTGRTCWDADCWLTTRTCQIIRLLHESSQDWPAEHNHLNHTQLRKRSEMDLRSASWLATMCINCVIRRNMETKAISAMMILWYLSTWCLGYLHQSKLECCIQGYGG